MTLEISFIILTVLLAALVLVLALSLLRLSLSRAGEKSEERSARPGLSETSAVGGSLTLRSARLLEHERAPELLAELAEQFEKDLNLEFAEFTLGDSDTARNSAGNEPKTKWRRIEFAKGMTGSFNWKERSGTELSADRLDEVAATAQAYVANLNRLQKYKRQALRDPLTGLFNAAYFRNRLDEEIKRAKRSDNSLGLMIIDVDNFKQINDTHGHPVGDKILNSLAKLLRENVRSTDIVARYGGDELCVILPDSDCEQTKIFMLRLHQRVRELTEGFQPTQATISIGAAVVPDQASDGESLFKAADDALLEAKRSGRNRAVMYTHQSETVS